MNWIWWWFEYWTMRLFKARRTSDIQQPTQQQASTAQSASPQQQQQQLQQQQLLPNQQVQITNESSTNDYSQLPQPQLHSKETKLSNAELDKIAILPDQQHHMHHTASSVPLMGQSGNYKYFLSFLKYNGVWGKLMGRRGQIIAHLFTYIFIYHSYLSWATERSETYTIYHPLHRMLVASQLLNFHFLFYVDVVVIFFKFYYYFVFFI